MQLTSLILATDELLNVEQVAARLGRTPDGIYGLTRVRNENPIPHRKLGKGKRARLVFSWQEVVAWIDSQPGEREDSNAHLQKRHKVLRQAVEQREASA